LLVVGPHGAHTHTLSLQTKTDQSNHTVPYRPIPFHTKPHCTTPHHTIPCPLPAQCTMHAAKYALRTSKLPSPSLAALSSQTSQPAYITAPYTRTRPVPDRTSASTYIIAYCMFTYAKTRIPHAYDIHIHIAPVIHTHTRHAHIHIFTLIHIYLHTTYLIHASIFHIVHTSTYIQFVCQAWPLRGLPTFVRVIEGSVMVVTVHLEALMAFGMQHLDDLDNFITKSADKGLLSDTIAKLLNDSPCFNLTPMSTLWVPFGRPSQPAKQGCRQWGSRHSAQGASSRPASQLVL